MKRGQGLGHLVEALRQSPEFVNRGHTDAPGEVTKPEGFHRLRELTNRRYDRPCEMKSHEGREYQRGEQHAPDNHCRPPRTIAGLNAGLPHPAEVELPESTAIADGAAKGRIHV